MDLPLRNPSNYLKNNKKHRSALRDRSVHLALEVIGSASGTLNVLAIKKLLRNQSIIDEGGPDMSICLRTIAGWDDRAKERFRPKILLEWVHFAELRS